MTNKAVTNVNGLMAGFGQSGIGRVGNNPTMSDSFSSVMQKTTNRNQMTEDSDLQPQDSVKPDIQSNTQVGQKHTKTAEQIEKNATDRTKEETPEGVEKAVTEVADKVVEKVADTLGISKEEVEQAMEMLGLTAVSLLDSTNLANLMLNLSGETDRMALVTNETLYADIQGILGMVQEELSSIQDTYGISMEQLNECVETLNEKEMQQLFTAVQERENGAETIPAFDVRKEEGTEEVVKQPEKAVITLTKGGEEIQAVVETDAKTGATVITQESNPLSGQNENSTETGQQGEGKEQQNEDTAKNSNLVLQNPVQNQNQTAAVNSTEPVFADMEQVQDIMNQIMDYMKVQIKPDTTSLEMQLHPENLGSLSIHIATKNGVLTAQFTAQNEAVKNVIESQLVTLQQNLNEQGVKVEAVEVNVATRQFDRNLNQGQGSNGRSSEEAKKKQTRRINLNDLDAFAEDELEEADRVTADMMARNGNTVDYLA